MSADREDALHIARGVADVLESRKIPYAIGGALALGEWSVPRGTQDVDLNIFLPPEEADRGLDALEAAGVTFDRAEATREIALGGNLRGRYGRTPVDVFFDSIPLHQEAARRVAWRTFLGRPAAILSAEDLAVLKLLFRRGKDLVDIERMVGVMGSRLDRAYVRRWLVDCVGEDDHRVVWWDELMRTLP